ncbi:MAG: Gfo/Idh/MocA family oxidoreductase [Chloroflexi bacterium]|nr:Gfo/Idh/MocA family oxidoreductase [Chloroflexota bacterium]
MPENRTDTKTSSVPRRVVVMGCGDWAKRYAAELEQYVRSGERRVTFCYDSRAGKGLLGSKAYHQYLQGIMSNVVAFESWGDGVECLDVSEQANHDRLAQKDIDVAFIVTPDDTHCYWARKFLLNARSIVVEKPFDASVANIDGLLADLNALRRAPRVRGFDHYLVRAHQFIQMTSDYFVEYLGGDIVAFRFHMLENTDRGMRERVASIQKGMALDMASHAPALILPFGNIETISTRQVKAGAYRGAEQLMRPAFGLKGGRETFAAIALTFESAFSTRTVSAEIQVGKNVGKREEKFVEVAGVNGRKIRLDLANYVVDFIDERGKVTPETYLFANPIHLLVREALAGRDMASLFSPETGRAILKQLEDWVSPITARLRALPLETYEPQEEADAVVSRLGGLL